MATTTPPEWVADPKASASLELFAADLKVRYNQVLGDCDKSADVEDAIYYEGVLAGLEIALFVLGWKKKE